jgi:hypothetical protein
VRSPATGVVVKTAELRVSGFGRAVAGGRCVLKRGGKGRKGRPAVVAGCRTAAGTPPVGGGGLTVGGSGTGVERRSEAGTGRRKPPEIGKTTGGGGERLLRRVTPH